MKKIVAINGESWAKNLTGIERVAQDTVTYLDKICSPNEFELVVPKNILRPAEFKNIKVVQLDAEAHFFPKWTQINFQRYVIKNHRLSFGFSNTCPYFAPGIEYLHDIYAKLYPADFKQTRRDRLIHLYSVIMYKRISRRAKKIIAVSEYTKKTIVQTYKTPEQRIEVVYDGLGTYRDIPKDDSIFERLPQLEEKKYYFTLGSLSTRKNLKWIAAHAQLFPNEIFAVSGKPIPSVVAPELKKLNSLNNVIMTGYLNDGEVKSLLSRCKAFVLPSYFEGFGLPPLEALSCGAKIIVSNRTSLPEIYKNCAYYIDPDNPDVNLDKLLEQPVEDPTSLLELFTLENTAKRLYEIVKDVNK
jgi:glycosyltransferase involved in cell wall biosynthesis